MIDIVSANQGQDLGIYDTETMRAANILSVQLRSLEYAKDLGIDLEYFLFEDFQFQNDSFKAYLVQVLANRGINVSSVTEILNTLYSQYTFNIASNENSTGLIAR